MVLISIMKQSDKIDNQIINALRKDAHMSSMEMSKQINIGASTIRRRINKLIKNDVIRIQAVEIDRVRTSLNVIVLLKVVNNAITRTANLLAAQKELVFISLTAGPYNILCNGLFESALSYSKFLNGVIYPLKGVLETDTLICIESRKLAFTKLSSITDTNKPTSKPIDDISMRIIEALEKDAHQSNTELAKSLNISVPTVKRRIKELLNRNIVRIAAIPNFRTEKTIVIGIALKVDCKLVDQIADYLVSIDEVRQVLLYSGTYDIGVYAWFDSIEAFSAFLKNVINPLEGVEKKITGIQTEIIKWTHLW